MKWLNIALKNNMKNTLDFSAARVLIVGDMMLDKYLHSDVNRISPEAPVPVAHLQHEEARPGGAANVAANCASLGARTRVLGILGEDENVRILQDILAEYSVTLCMPLQPELSTITKLRIVSRGHQLLRLDVENRIGRQLAKSLQPYFELALPEADVVVFSDYGKGSLAEVQTLIAKASAMGKTTIVDPKGTDFERYRGASIITPNLLEFTSVVGPCSDDAELVDKARNLAIDLELRGILVTRSERGMTYVPSAGDVVSVPAQIQDVFDVTGAGDTVVAALAVAIASGQSLEDAILLSNLCAGIVVGKVGTSTVSFSELDAARARRRTSGRPRTGKDQETREKLISVAELREIREKLRRDGHTVVMTNGCFDVLHAGHVRYINAASRKGDVLVIAVNSDSSVRTLKGDNRPINSLEARMEVLAALQHVDWVVSFSDLTPQRLYTEILPDILVKGADYEGKAVAGADEVIKSGGRLELIDFLDGYSTTSVIEKIKGNEK